MSSLGKKELYWRCRRGMLELDILLNRFLEQHYEQLNDHQKADFIRLLEASDQDLFSWLMGVRPVDDQRLQSLIEKIRHYAED